MKNALSKSLALITVMTLGACGEKAETPGAINLPDKNPYPSTYQIPESPAFALIGANILTGEGTELTNTDLLIENGKIVAIGAALDIEPDTIKIDAQGKWVTPGLIDVHSHMGVYPSPSTSNHSDGNEMTSPVTAEVWAEHSVWPEDP
jgi:imidazolonepropionase-like amidohydrolase/predicted small lipoprotein YifL